MFVAPLPIPSVAASRRGRPRPSRLLPPPRTVLAIWLVIGLVAIALVPGLRGGAAFGATAPFWLVLAPAIDLAWLARWRVLGVLARIARRTWLRARPQAARLQSARRPRRSSR